MKYHPKNIGNALLCFLLGSILTWWCAIKIDIFTGFFSNAFPKVFIWVAFFLLFIQWVLIIPYMIATGSDDLNILTMTKSFLHGFLGIAYIVVGLPIANVFIESLNAIFADNVAISFFSWLIVICALIYFAIWKPFQVIMPAVQK